MNIQLMLSLLSALRKLRQHDRWTRQQLEAHQASSLRLLRAYAYAHSFSTSSSTKVSRIVRYASFRY